VNASRTGISNLRVEYNKVHGFYMKSTPRPDRIKYRTINRRRQTPENAERYITPELKALKIRRCRRKSARCRVEKLSV